MQAREAHRDIRAFAWLEDARRDIRYALRALRRTPGFAAVAILTLALAIGAATAIFSVIDVALLRPLPYEKPEEIVSIGVGETFDERRGLSADDIDRWRTVVTSIAFGLAPAVKLSRASVSAHTAGPMRHGSALTPRGGQVLIAVEMAMALVLVTGAALMIRSFSKILAIDPGFELDAMITMEVTPVDADLAAQETYYFALLQSLRQIPGVVDVGAADRPPLDGSGSYTSATANGRSMSVARRSVLPGYFEAIGSPLRQGRLPTDADYHSGLPFAVLSESAAHAMFPGQSAVGQQFLLRKTFWTVVAVVGDARNKTLLPQESERPDLYLAHQFDEPSLFGGLTVVVRPAGRIPRLAELLRHAAHAVGPPVIVDRIRPGREWFGDQVATPRQRTTMLSLLGGLGWLLTLVGIFGTTAYTVARRTREVGIRMALGARPRRMVGAIVSDALWPLALGIAIGLAGAAAVTRMIASFLFETAPTDPLMFVTTVVALTATALVAAWIPARRAAYVDPVQAVRAE